MPEIDIVSQKGIKPYFSVKSPYFWSQFNSIVIRWKSHFITSDLIKKKELR